jgi:hypothetical protein
MKLAGIIGMAYRNISRNFGLDPKHGSGRNPGDPDFYILANNSSSNKDISIP